MFYLVIGIVVVVAVGAIIQQRSRHVPVPQDTEQDGGAVRSDEGAGTEVSDSVVLSHPVEKAQTPSPQMEFAPTAKLTAADVAPAMPLLPQADPEPEAAPDREIIPLKPQLAAAPISSPNALSSATYSSAAPPVLSGDSPYAHGNTLEEIKPKPETTLLRWSGKTGSIQVGDLSVRGPVAYWSEGPGVIPEPSCIDVMLPVEYPSGENELPNEGATSYREMAPLQRGVYLLWLAGGRIQPPSHVCYPALWLFGLERRVLSDRLDIAICIGEAFRLLPLIRWDSLQLGLIKFITWMAAKIWLPEEQLLAFSRSLPSVPAEILNMLLRPYADAKLPLPSIIAFTVMRASPLGGDRTVLQHSDELLAQFSPKYKSKCEGGLVLAKPKNSLFVAYVPTNPSLAADKNAVGGVLELPDFFKDTTNFAPLVTVWKEFLKTVSPSPDVAIPAPNAVAEVSERPDWESFTLQLRGGSEGEGSENDGSPVITDLEALARLMRLDSNFQQDDEGSQEEHPQRHRKPGAADRKKISDAARIEGFLVLPNLGIAGKEYYWDDPVVLTPLEMGARLSKDYNAASLLLEFSCALTQLNTPEALTKLEEKLNGYFSLSSDDHARLAALGIVLLTRPTDPDNIGECLQFWLQRDQRGTVRDFLTDFLAAPLPEEQRAGLTRTILGALDVGKDDPPPLVTETLLELGECVGKVLAPLFKD